MNIKNLFTLEDETQRERNRIWDQIQDINFLF